MGLLKKAKKAVGKVFNPVIKPFQKISDKFLPNELRPFLPYATMFLPGSGILGAMGGAGGFAKMYAANMLTQALGDPEAEFEDLNQLSGIMSGAQGALSGVNTAENLRGMTTQEKLLNDPSMLTKEGIMNQMATAPIGSSSLAEASGRGLLGGAKDLALNMGAGTSDYLTGNINTLRDLGSGRSPLNLETFKEAGKAIAPDFAKATGDVAVNFARPAIREFEEADRLEQAQIEETTTADESQRADLQMTFMRQAGHDEETIEETLVQNDLGAYYEPPVETAAYGGLMGNNKTYHQYHDQYIPMDSEGIMSYNRGGNVLPQGTEMDYRGGGFIPMGSKEKADDVPARLSKNEFVMTADAVKAAGGGSVNEGAKRMYEIMNKLEARA